MEALFDPDEMSSFDLIPVSISLELLGKLQFQTRKGPASSLPQPAPVTAKPIPKPRVSAPESISTTIESTPILSQKPEPFLFSTTIVTLCKQGFPNLHFKEQIPEDHSARILKQQYLWKYPGIKIIILSFATDPAEKLLWKRLSEALCNERHKSLCIDALTIDHPEKWRCIFNNSFSLIIAPVKTILTIPTLVSSYLFSPTNREHYLFGIKLFPVRPGYHYLQQPELKKDLWTALCNMLLSQKSP